MEIIKSVLGTPAWMYDDRQISGKNRRPCGEHCRMGAFPGEWLHQGYQADVEAPVRSARAEALPLLDAEFQIQNQYRKKADSERIGDLLGIQPDTEEGRLHLLQEGEELSCQEGDQKAVHPAQRGKDGKLNGSAFPPGSAQAGCRTGRFPQSSTQGGGKEGSQNRHDQRVGGNGQGKGSEFSRIPIREYL